MPTIKYEISMHALTIEVLSWRRPSWVPREFFSTMLNLPRAKIQLPAASLLQMSPSFTMALTTTVTGHRWILFHPSTGQSRRLSIFRHNKGKNQNDWCSTGRRATSRDTQQTLKIDQPKLI